MACYKIYYTFSKIQFWLLNDKYHRENGPAAIYPSGNLYWFQNGKLHREDGPAVIYIEGKKSWYLNNIKFALV
jgi:hypothetical protein